VRVSFTIEERRNGLEDKGSIPPGQVTDTTLVMDQCFLSTALASHHFLFLGEQGCQLSLLREVDRMRGHELKEPLQLPSRYFSHLINLLHQLLEQHRHKPRQEFTVFINLQCFAGISMLFDVYRFQHQSDQPSQANHGLFTNPRSHISPSIDCIVFQSGKHYFNNVY